MIDNFFNKFKLKNMGSVIPINSSRIFTQDDAEELLPVVKRLAERAATTVTDLQEQLRWTPQEEPLYKRLSNKIESTVKIWATKISRLGCEPRGIWLVDFDAGEGWFSWRFGDDGLNFFHSHKFSIDRALFSEELPT
mgnify:CR=1 FL=1